MEISYRHLVQIAQPRHRAQQLLHRTCQGDLAHDLLQRSSQRERELAESDLVSLFALAAPKLFTIISKDPSCTLFGVSCIIDGKNLFNQFVIVRSIILMAESVQLSSGWKTLGIHI